MRYPMFCLMLLGVLLVIGLIPRCAVNELDAEQIQYCKMVAQYKTSDGEYGWPDYERSFDLSCNADGSVKEL